MSRELMRMRCKGARALGTAMLLQWRFGLNSDGLASVSPHRGQRVHGVLWRLTLRDLSALNAYESIDCGLYRPRLLPVHSNNGTRTALVYIGRQSNRAKPRPDHIQTVLQAAREWGLPEPYLRSLARWSASRWTGTRRKDTGEVGCRTCI